VKIAAQRIWADLAGDACLFKTFNRSGFVEFSTGDRLALWDGPMNMPVTAYQDDFSLAARSCSKRENANSNI
jgi:hypothetical protein